MPHKHKRKRDENEDTHFNLAPGSVTRSIPVGKQPQAKSKKRKTNNLQDDTPKAFARMLQFQKTGIKTGGLDNGEPRKKPKSKASQVSDVVEEKTPSTPEEDLKIKPGERMAEFAARVNQALPINGLSKKGKKVDGVRAPATKLQKKITRKQDAWRRDEAQLKEKEEEARDQAEEDEDDEDYWKKDGKVSKRQKRLGVSGKKEDPWAHLKDAREKPKGVFDVNKAPPTFKKLPTEKFKVRNGARVNVANVPSGAGSLRQRETLGETRMGIIESYRKLMHSKRDIESF